MSRRLDEAIAGRGRADLVEAVRALAEELNEEERAELRRVLLRRAREQGGFDDALIQRPGDPYRRLFGLRRD